MKRLFLLTLLGLFPLVASAATFQEQQTIANAPTAERKGLAIVEIADKRDNGWKDSEANMLMILRNRRGQESRRKVRVRAMEVENDGDKGLSIFDTPRDVKGTVVLTWSHPLKPDHQWIYMPALKRVKRISSRNKSGPFMGSEFAYEDIASQEVKKYTYEYLMDDVFRGVNCYVVKRYPAYRYSGYTRQEVWFDKEHFNPQKIVFYDRKKSLLKTLIFKEYRQYLGKYWRAHNMEMENHQTGKSTTLKWKTYSFGNDFKVGDFKKTAMKRIR